jgi:hypothetical protein
MELLLAPSDVGRPAVDSGRWPGIARARVVPMRVWAKLDAPLGIAPRFTDSESVVLLLHYRAVLRTAVKVAWSDCPKAIGPRFMALLSSDGVSVETYEAQSPRIISLAASESSQRAEVYFVFIGVNAILPTHARRRLDGLAGSSNLKREDAAIVWYLAPWMTS